MTDEELNSLEKQQESLLKDKHLPAIFDEKLNMDFDETIHDVAESLVYIEMERERLQASNREIKDFDFGEFHKNHNIKIVRDIEPNFEKKIFEENFKEELSISRKLSAQFKKELGRVLPNNKVYGLNKKRFDIKSTYKNEVNFYSRSKSPTDNDLAICLLVDESGSMEGQRNKQAKKSSIIIYQFCKNFGIPLSIYGHSDSHFCTTMYSYSEFDSIDGCNDIYRLQNISSRSVNRDGLALRFCYQVLAKRKEKRKLLIIISDGKPYSVSYGFAIGKEDIQSAKLEYQRKGIVTFASAIGDDKESIEEIYKDGFLDMTDLNKLSLNLIKLIKKHIK